MAIVTDEDRAWARELCTSLSMTKAVAAVRERIDARKDAVIAERDKRIADLEVQLDDAKAARDRANDKIIEMGDMLAAAKPVLTAEDEQCCKVYAGAERIAPSTRVMVEMVRKYTVPYVAPKAPPTDAELADKLTRALYVTGDERDDEIRSVAVALRARGGK